MFQMAVLQGKLNLLGDVVFVTLLPVADG